MINDLPNELVLNVLSHAPIKTVHSLRLVCHQMNDLIRTQETSIYHNAAIFHGFVPANLPYDKIYSSRSLVGVDGWKSFCQRRVLIAQGWLGRQPSMLRQHSSTAPNSKVHRFKIDECRGFIISTSSEGSLNVTDLATGETLWALDKELNYLKNIIQAQEASIYRNAAILHGYVPFDAHYDNIYPPRSLVGVDGWKSFCQRRALIPQSWLGRQPSRLRQHSSTAPNSKVHRFKIDERRGFIVSTSSEGSLNVTDLATGETLWALDKKLNYVRRFAHCEYGEGFVVFDRMDGSKEVWRLVSEYDTSPPPALSLPDPRQLDAYARSCALYPASRAHFRPWLLLHVPFNTHALSFVYPSLLVSGLHQAIIFDVSTGLRVQRIDELQDAPHLHQYSFNRISVRDVGLTAQHVLVCCAASLKVFSRATGACILQIGSHENLYGQHRFRLIPGDTKAAPHPDAELVECCTQQEIYTRWPPGFQFDHFVAVRVSPCGAHVAVLLSCSRLIVFPNFERIVAGKAYEHDVAIDIELGRVRYESIDLAYEHDRIAVATAGGVFVVHLHLDRRLPDITVHRVARMTDPDNLQYVSCMQMTDTGLFVNCKPSPDPEHASRRFNRNLSDDFATNVEPLGDGHRLVVAPPHEAVAAVSTIYDLNLVSL
ncbi:hypothetical protein EYR36_004152 [Pleurotus pulmonarius]|nr:hypothetical protein EYR36_004152 [Pleurotus pulmonarius]